MGLLGSPANFLNLFLVIVNLLSWNLKENPVFPAWSPGTLVSPSLCAGSLILHICHEHGWWVLIRFYYGPHHAAEVLRTNLKGMWQWLPLWKDLVLISWCTVCFLLTLMFHSKGSVCTYTLPLSFYFIHFLIARVFVMQNLCPIPYSGDMSVQVTTTNRCWRACPQSEVHLSGSDPFKPGQSQLSHDMAILPQKSLYPESIHLYLIRKGEVTRWLRVPGSALTEGTVGGGKT